MSRADTQATPPALAGRSGGPGNRQAYEVGPVTTRPRRIRSLGVGALAGTAVLLGACGSPSTSQASASVASSCQAVAAVLTNGPSPAVDPVGYAEAQIRLLTEVRIGDPALRHDVERLDRAYRQVFETDGSPSAVSAARTASARLDAACPQAAPALRAAR